MADARIVIRERGYFSLSRSAAQDGRLTLETRGLLALMLSLPTDWDYTVTGLAVKANCGREKLRRMVRELETVGYLVREQVHGEGGQFSGNVYVLQDAPPLDGFSGNGDAQNPTVAQKHRQRQKPSTVFRPEQIIKENNKRTPYIPREISERVAAYCGEDRELLDALTGLLENRAAIDRGKAVKTGRALTGILNRLDKLSGGRREVKLALLDKATSMNWLTVYELKPDELPSAAGQVAELPLGWGV